MSFFDAELKKEQKFCEQCQKVTEHGRYNERALMMCRDPEHVHPPREE